MPEGRAPYRKVIIIVLTATVKLKSIVVAGYRLRLLVQNNHHQKFGKKLNSILSHNIKELFITHPQNQRIFEARKCGQHNYRDKILPKLFPKSKIRKKNIFNI